MRAMLCTVLVQFNLQLGAAERGLSRLSPTMLHAQCLVDNLGTYKLWPIRPENILTFFHRYHVVKVCSSQSDLGSICMEGHHYTCCTRTDGFSASAPHFLTSSDDATITTPQLLGKMRIRPQWMMPLETLEELRHLIQRLLDRSPIPRHICNLWH